MTDQHTNTSPQPAIEPPTQPATPREPWTFTRRDDEPLTLTEAVGQAIGSASACWEHLDRAGVFDSTRAKQIVDALLAEIHRVREADAAHNRFLMNVHGVVDELVDAIRLTVEYLGTDTLPPVPGWSWYDALRKYAPHVAERFADEHRMFGKPPRPAARATPALVRLTHAAEAYLTRTEDDAATRAELRAHLAAAVNDAWDVIRPGPDMGPAAEHDAPPPARAEKRTARRRSTPTPPTLGRTVRYVGKHGIHATRAALVACTVDELDPAGDAPALDSPMHAHLFVITPSGRGFFTEYNIPHDPGGAPGTWHWPDRSDPNPIGLIGQLNISPPPRIVPVAVPVDPRTGRMLG
ncbi:hypothetical protein AB0B88_15910 [Micromonospora haikouensis]|uniref:hypothetical protein n=1 Tax=Micromonospora haikouensis TaxID=686309 RepID=UPI0033CF2FDF